MPFLRFSILPLILFGLHASSLHGLTLREFRALPDTRIAVRTSFGMRSAFPTDDRHIRVAFGMSVSDACRKADAYRIVSFEDSRYAYERFIRPVEVAANTEKEAETLAGAQLPLFLRTTVTLEAPFPFKSGPRYYVIAQGSDGAVVTGGHTAQGFVYAQNSRIPLRDPNLDRAVLGLRRLEPVGPRLVMLEFGPDFSPEAGSDPRRYHVTLNRRPVKAVRLGRISRVDTYLPVGWPFPAIPMHEIYLQLSEAFRNGDRIAVSVDSGVTTAQNCAELVFNEAKTLSNSLKVNQVGYLSDAPVKTAYLGRWMGSFPEPPLSGSATSASSAGNPSLLFDSPPPFFLCDAKTGNRAFTGRSKLIHTSGQRNEGLYKVDHSGENVYRLDFTAFRRPGRYYIRVPGVGRSLSFEIGSRIYERAFKVQGYGLFAQRCGIALGPPYSPWHRIACHKKGILPTTQDRYLPHDLGDLPKKVDARRNGGTEKNPSILRAFGGHHDAGDYNPRSHIDVAQTLMDAYEMAPRHYYDGQLAMPEAGNGIPDLLDEARWALRLWEGLQDADGGVFDGTESNGDPNFYETVELDPLGDYAYAKDGPGTLTFAGTMAQASRIWKSLGRAKESAAFLQRALRAYRWALQHPPDDPALPQAERGAYLDEKAYAAAELLLTTRESGYEKDFEAACVWSKNPEADLEVYQQYDQSRAAWAYSRCPAPLANPSLQKAARAAILRAVDGSIAASSRMAYGFLRHPQSPITWGTGALLHGAIPASWAYHLIHKEKYLAWILRSCDNTLGANPLNRSYIVGLGTRTVRAPLHNSRYSHLGEVVEGMQVNGPFEQGDGYHVKETAYPKIQRDFASLYTFVDAHFAIGMDEGLSRNQAEALAIFGLLLPNRRGH